MADATPNPEPDSYLRIRRRLGREYVHRVVLLAKIGPGEHPCHWCSGMVSWDKPWPDDPDSLCVDHLDGNKRNNDPANLVPSHGACNTRRAAVATAERERRERQKWWRLDRPPSTDWPPVAGAHVRDYLDSVRGDD